MSTVILAWDRDAHEYRVTCEYCETLDVIVYRNADGTRAKYQPGEARTKAGTLFRKHVNRHEDKYNPTRGPTRQEMIAKNIQRQGPMTGSARKALAIFGIGDTPKIPADPNDPPPF